MSTSLKKRIINSLLEGTILFIICAVFLSILNYGEDAISISGIIAGSWSIGYFISMTMEIIEINNLKKRFLDELIILAIVIVAITFINNFVIKLYLCEYMLAIFGTSLLLCNKI